MVYQVMSYDHYNTVLFYQEVSHGYWPTGVNDEMCVGKLSVTLTSERQRKDYIERKLKIKEDEVGVSIWDEVGMSCGTSV